ncbi:MAG: hypothetical protein KDB68_17165 [Planctomycetes bacterium]|nr:hypothetical protein [Planctomycetota bacterium]
MIRRFSFVLIGLLALPLFISAQDAPTTSRTVEVRIVALSRGYMRPMRFTADRIAEQAGIDKAIALGFEGDTARYSITTDLDNTQLAAGLQLQVLGESDGRLTLAADSSPRARHAEARGVLMQIALKIATFPRPNWRGTSDRIFKPDAKLADKLERLGLSTDMLKGATYKPEQYHIDEDWGGSSAEYRVWVGEKYEGVQLPNSDDPWGSEDTGDPEVAPNPDSDFVGIQIYRGPWQETINWVDVEGLQLNGYDGERSDTDSDGELYVAQGADWLEKILQAVTALHLHNPKGKVSDLPHGTGWRIIQDFNDDDLQRWGQTHYNIADFRMRWREEDGERICNLRAHNPSHPFYLEAEVNATQVLGFYNDRKEKDPELNLSKVERAELGSALTWICGAEESVEVFNLRRQEAGASMKLIREAIKQALAEHALADLCGRLDDPELIERLGVELPTDAQFKPGDYTVHQQMLGDVEISVGNVRTGGRWWQLVNASRGEILRSNQ